MGALYGHTVDSDLPLGRLRQGSGPRGVLEVRRAPGRLEPTDGEPVVRIGDGFSVHRTARGLTVWCRATGTFVLDPFARRITTEPAAEPGDGWLHRLACVAVPLLLAEAGDLALHASAVDAEGGGAIAFLGASGAGKSTTAWALGARGLGVLAEDGCVVTGGAAPLLWPGLTGVRLPGARRGKRPAPTRGDSARPAELRAIVLLQPRGGAAATLEPVRPAEALPAMMPHTMHAQGRSLEAAFRGAAGLARSVPVFRGRLPDDLAGAPDHAERLVRLVLAAARSHDA